MTGLNKKGASSEKKKGVFDRVGKGEFEGKGGYGVFTQLIKESPYGSTKKRGLY